MVDGVGSIKIDGVFGIWFNDPADHNTQTNFSWLSTLPTGETHVESHGKGNMVTRAFAESVVPEPGTASAA